MRTFFLLVSACVVMALAFWAYRENYATQRALNTLEDLHRDIGVSRDRLAVQRAEWAYLNRPDRLRALAEINFDRLGLLPFRAEQFGTVDQVSYPVAPIDLSRSVEVSSANAPETPVAEADQ